MPIGRLNLASSAIPSLHPRIFPMELTFPFVGEEHFNKYQKYLFLNLFSDSVIITNKQAIMELTETN